MFLGRFNNIPAHSISVRLVRVKLVFPDLNCVDDYTDSTSERYEQFGVLLIEQVEKLHINTAHAHYPCALDKCTGHAHWTCALPMRTGHVHWTCALDMRTGHAH